MINRILIRIKVVQLLYSYLLTRNNFSIKSAPDKNTRDARFAYKTYLDLLFLILKLSGQRLGSNAIGEQRFGQENPLTRSKMAISLADDSEVRELIGSRSTDVRAYDDILVTLYDNIMAAEVTRDYRKKRRREISDDVTLWVTLLRTVIVNSPVFLTAARECPDFTTKGLKEGVEMLVSTLQDYSDTKSILRQADKSLEASLDKAYELYHALLMLPVEITNLQAERIEMAKEKYRPTEEDLNPNMRFVNNRYVAMISDNQEMAEYQKKHPFTWENDFYLVKKLLEKITASEYYRNYMAAPTDDLAADCEFWHKVMKHIVLPSDELAEALEPKSVYWNDDLHIMGTFVLKTIKKFASAQDGIQPQLLPMFRDDEHEKFGYDLFKASFTNADTYRGYINRFINPEQWDSERLAFMDIVIMIAGIAEMLNFPSIPVPVTMNEYVEIANYYSSPRSGQFVNGMLFAVANHLNQEGILLKSVTN